MNRWCLALCAAGFLLAGCAADPVAPVIIQTNFITSYWFQDKDPSRSAEPSPPR